MKKILLIEDNPEVRENTREILELEGYTVLIAEDGKTGVKLAQKNLPDLIVCDIMMSGLDGYGVLHILNKNPLTSVIPFIFLTAKADRIDIRKGMGLGADDYLTKPFDSNELLTAIETRLNRHNEASQEEFYIKDLDPSDQNKRAIASLNAIAAEGRIQHFRAGEGIYWEGDEASALILVNSGKIKTYKTNQEKKKLITGIYCSGKYIGFNALITNSNYSESAVALEDSELYFISRHKFFKLLYENRDVANKFIRIISNNLKEKEEQMLHLAYNSVKQRAAEALVSLQKKSKKCGEIFISREDLANMVGTAPESVIRALSDFREARLINVSPHHIDVFNLKELKKIAAID
ncbi:MAG: response regulator [Reichenbachiella sp.]|uniref:response regulator n=1 Tax=Reichenbachiella sp. TaxID=2184521 RepID=UPI0032640D0A